MIEKDILHSYFSMTMIKKRPPRKVPQKKPRKKGGPRLWTPERALEAVRACRGKLHLAAKKLGISYTTLYKATIEHPEIMEAVEDAREYMLDVTEDALYTAIMRKEPWAIKFHLETQGRERGYGNKVSLQHGGDPENAIPISYSHDELNLPLDVRKALLEAIRAKQAKTTVDVEVKPVPGLKELPAPKENSNGSQEESSRDSGSTPSSDDIGEAPLS